MSQNVGVSPLRYTTQSGRRIAYDVVGDGPETVVANWGFFSHIEVLHTIPGYTAFLERLAGSARVVTFDVGGIGASGNGSLSTADERLEDLAAVLDAVDASAPVLLGVAGGAALMIGFSARYQGIASGLVLYGGYPTFRANADVPFMVNDELLAGLQGISRLWGRGLTSDAIAPSIAVAPNGRELWGSLELAALPDGRYAEALSVELTVDTAPLLSDVDVPVLVLHRINEQFVPPQAAIHLSKSIPGARLALMDGIDHPPWLGNSAQVVDSIRSFMAGEAIPERSIGQMRSVLMTDIVSSTEKIVGLGDERWHEQLAKHDEIAEREVADERGRLVKSTGDGILAVFDHPANALRCAVRLRDEVSKLGIPVRSGVTVGEIVERRNDVGGLCVHIANRIANLAEAGQILVSRGATIMIDESHLEFIGLKTFKGVPGDRSVFELR